MITRLGPLLAGLLLAAASCSEQPATTGDPTEVETVRFSVPKLDG